MGKFEKYLGKNVIDGTLEGISDAGKTAGYAKDALAWAYTSGLIPPKSSDGKLYIEPTSQATRAQVSKALVVLAGI